MGIYIKDFKMPEGGYRTIEIAYDADGHPMALADGGDVFDVIPVPPHGRLKDTDAFVNKHFGKEFLSKVMVSDEDDLGTALVNIPLIINNAPTIIPEEEGET